MTKSGWTISGEPTLGPEEGMVVVSTTPYSMSGDWQASVSDAVVNLAGALAPIMAHFREGETVELSVRISKVNGKPKAKEGSLILKKL